MTLEEEGGILEEPHGLTVRVREPSKDSMREYSSGRRGSSGRTKLVQCSSIIFYMTRDVEKVDWRVKVGNLKMLARGAKFQNPAILMKRSIMK
jgi:hypothetical protein